MTYVAVISSGRPGAPRRMAEFLGQRPATWYVGEDEQDDYATVKRPMDSIAVGGGLIDSRNAALEDAFSAGHACLQLSDDLSKLARLQSTGDAAPMFLDTAMREMLNASESTGANLVGVAPTTNLLWASMKLQSAAFCVGDMILVQPSAPRFDTALRLKEDYDFTAQHLAEYGKVARCDWILATFAHRTNRGGAVAYRTPEVEQEAIAYLKAKWPGVIVDNPKRPDEVLFKWKHHDAEAVTPVPEQAGFGL